MNNSEFNILNSDCNISGVCSMNPAIEGIKFTVFALLQEWAFYSVKVNEFGASNICIQNKFFVYFSFLATNFEYEDSVIINLINNIIKDIKEIKSVYKKICDEKNIKTLYYKPKVKFNKILSISDIIKKGQNYRKYFKNKLTKEQYNFYEIIVLILKSICFYVKELLIYNVDISEYYIELLHAIYPKKFNVFSTDDYKKIIDKYTDIDHQLLQIVFDIRKKKFGEFCETKILKTPKQGKAILVAGTNFKDLEFILEATKNSDINIYTYEQMITAHCFEKFKKYSHLIGNYGRGAEFYLSDFANFPGPILLTKMSPYRVENLFSAKIFSCENYNSKNTIPIINNDFSEIIKFAQFSDGFNENFSKDNTKKEDFLKIGIVECDYIKKIETLKQNIINNKIKNIITIGVSNKSSEQLDYLKTFISLLKDNSFTISFNYTTNKKNIFFANIDYAFPFLYKNIEQIEPFIEDYNLKINFLFTRCETHTFPNLLYLKRIKNSKVFLHNCPAILINPALLDFLVQNFDIQRYTTPENDLKIMLN